ncbi:MAG: N-acetylneuraminate synthase family protein [Oligoflexia bacterium]|nr:N-acetylneuraminate synthase family protein [Oligoflexia bacterium]
MKIVKVGNRIVGEGHPCFVILELGLNFKDMNEAKKLIDMGIEIGADAIKFQTFHAHTLAMKDAVLYDGRGIINQYEEAFQSEDRLTDAFQGEIINYAKSRGVITFSTPSHKKDIDLLNRIGVDAFKFGSDDLTNLPILKYAAKFNKPIFISSGVANLSDIDEAIRTIREECNDNILLFHCVTQYPAKPEDMNLRSMVTLSNAFDVPVGLSDHTEGIAVSIAAAALGANMIEKHFTLSKKEDGPDNFFSMEPKEMQQIISGIREVELAKGIPYKRIRKVEEEMVVNFHKSIFALNDIKKGKLITIEDVENLRPCTGIPAKYLDIVVGMTPIKDIKKGQAIQWGDFK